ncbi:hypothetical protein D3C78_1576500 [compost metagenome]
MGTTIQAEYGLAVEIFQFQRRDAPAVFTAQHVLRFFDVLFRDKRHGFLRRQRHIQRAIVGRQPEFDLSPLRGIPPVSGQ